MTRPRPVIYVVRPGRQGPGSLGARPPGAPRPRSIDSQLSTFISTLNEINSSIILERPPSRGTARGPAVASTPRHRSAPSGQYTSGPTDIIENHQLFL
ncbi:hypothetical protein EVAR_48462_1 [Eumeta japonica]|uniref:Uncharacterized protein n=1 Tax=Eumeta variegata TaxID=151549 RepID=A0A4C1XJ09_EUMVA|nr:hypothetical protein EVAR_48462_1 [Eumeta japonica]